MISRTGQRIKTDSKLIRAAINVAHSALNDEPYNLSEVAAKVVMEDGRTQSPMMRK